MANSDNSKLKDPVCVWQHGPLRIIATEEIAVSDTPAGHADIGSSSNGFGPNGKGPKIVVDQRTSTYYMLHLEYREFDLLNRERWEPFPISLAQYDGFEMLLYTIASKIDVLPDWLKSHIKEEFVMHAEAESICIHDHGDM